MPDKQEQAKQALQRLMNGHERFLAGQGTQKKYLCLKTLAEANKTVATVLCCSDSRVAPELVFDQTFGDLFVIRTAGHSVSSVALGSIEFAVEQVDSPLLIVMGHEDCRAVDTALNGGKQETPYLRAITADITPSFTEMSKEGDRLTAAVHAHVRRTARLLGEQSPVLSKRIANGELTVVCSYYRVSTGEFVLL